MGNTNPLVLVYKGMDKISIDKSINVMLPPQFYTLKREAIPVSYAYQAKRIAPSLFDGLLEENKKYEYFVSKEEEDWVFIAYDIEAIQIFLNENGIKENQVGKIFFAQQAVDALKKPLKLGENEALVSLEGIAVVVPRVALSEEEQLLSLDDINTPSKGVSLEGGSTYLPMMQTLSLAIIFLMFSGIFFVEGLRYGGESDTQKEEMQRLLEAYPTLQSSYSRKSIANKYKTIDTEERKKREIIKSLSHMIFKGSTLTLLSIDDKKFYAQFSCKNSRVSSKLKELAKKEKFNTSNVKDSSDLRIEGRL